MSSSTYLVTGGTTGIGLATAKLLSSQGAKVLVTGRNPETLEAAKKELPNAIIFKSDSASLDDNQALGALVSSHTKTLDGVFLNAGVGQFGPLEAMTPKHFDDMFHINVRGVYFQLQSLLPVLANPSSVVLNASVVARLGFPTASMYSATKAAVVSLGKSLAVELAPRGIRVNTVSPGPIHTPIYNKLGFDAASQKGFEEAMAAQSLFKRFGSADEIAKAVRFLLTSESSYIVGEELLVDGGVSLT